MFYAIIIETFPMKNKQKGFTLIELLVVISIIGLLASVVLVALSGARKKSRDAKRVADLNQLSKAMELYFNDVFAYPTGVGAAGAVSNYVPTTIGSGGNIFGSALLASYNAAIPPSQIIMTPTYIITVPTAPLPADGSCTTSNNSYYYETNARGSTYTFTFCVGANTGALSPGIHFLTPGGFK